MTLTPDQINQLIENYAERRVDDMDTKCLMQFVYDAIVENLQHMGDEEILDQIACVYDEETLQEMIENVTDQKVSQDLD